jgi:hypothetical protein
MPAYYRGKARAKKEVSRPVAARVRRLMAESLRANADIFPGLDRSIRQAVQERHPEVRTLEAALGRMVRYEGWELGGIKKANIVLQHPTNERRRALVGRVSWDAEGVRTEPTHEQAVWPIARLLDHEPRQAPIRGYLPGLEPSAREINKAFEMSRIKREEH